MSGPPIGAGFWVSVGWNGMARVVEWTKRAEKGAKKAKKSKKKGNMQHKRWTNVHGGI
jgi:hypothetical protein